MPPKPKLKTINLTRRLNRLANATAEIARQRNLALNRLDVARAAVRVRDGQLDRLHNPGTRDIIARRARVLAILEGLQTEFLALLDEAEARG